MAHTGEPTAPPIIVRSRRCHVMILYLCMVVFGVSTWLPSNAIWVETPMLERNLVEGTSITNYIVLANMGGFTMSLIYLAFSVCTKGKCNEVPYICLNLIVQIVSLTLLALVGNKTTLISGELHSLMFVTCTTLTSLGSCFSAVAHVMFAWRLEPSSMNGVLLGETFGYLLPYVMGIAQGAGVTDVCEEREELVLLLWNKTRETPGRPDAKMVRSLYASSTKAPLVTALVRFDMKIYFLVHTGIMLLSAAAFIYVCYVRIWHTPVYDQNLHHEISLGVANEDSSSVFCDGYMLDDGTYRHTTSPAARQSRGANDSTPQRFFPGTRHEEIARQGTSGESPQYIRSHRVSSSSFKSSIRSYRSDRTSSFSSEYIHPRSDKHPQQLTLLMMIACWACAVNAGPLATSKSFTCIPLNNTIFLAGALLVNVFRAFGVLATVKFTPKTKITLLVAFSALATILLAYLVALMGFSHTSERRDSPIFGSAGEFLAVSFANTPSQDCF